MIQESEARAGYRVVMRAHGIHELLRGLSVIHSIPRMTVSLSLTVPLRHSNKSLEFTKEFANGYLSFLF